MTSDFWGNLLKNKGYNFFTGVPCTLLKDVISSLDNDPSINYIPAVREDAALGLAAGAWLAGRKPVVLMQNSGLGYSLNALNSLHQIYKIPVLLVIAWRGRLGKDAPEHLVMGEIMLDLLDLSKIPFKVPGKDNIEGYLDQIDKVIADTRSPGALVLTKEVVS